MIKFLSIFVTFSLLLSANVAFASSFEKYLPEKDTKSSNEKMMIIESQEIERVIEKRSSDDGFGTGYWWENLHKKYSLKFSDGSEAIVTPFWRISWGSSSKQDISPEALEEILLFEFQEGDEILFNRNARPKGYDWDSMGNYGRYVEFTLYRNDDFFGEFKGYYAVPESNAACNIIDRVQY